MRQQIAMVGILGLALVLATATVLVPVQHVSAQTIGGPRPPGDCSTIIGGCQPAPCGQNSQGNCNSQHNEQQPSPATGGPGTGNGGPTGGCSTGPGVTCTGGPGTSASAHGGLGGQGGNAG